MYNSDLLITSDFVDKPLKCETEVIGSGFEKKHLSINIDIGSCWYLRKTFTIAVEKNNYI